MSETKKVFIRTFGCQMNEYDSDKMADVLRAAEGYEPTTDVEQADLILFNTCSVREKAQEKVFSDLGRVKHLKKKGVLIGVGGCVASQEGAAIIDRAPYVDLVFGPQTLHRLPQMIAARTLERPVDFARAAIGFCDLSEWAPRDAEARGALEEALDRLGARTYLPAHETIGLCQDKLELTRHLAARGIRVPETHPIGNPEQAKEVFCRFGQPDRLWCRMRRGGGSKGSLPVRTCIFLAGCMVCQNRPC